MKFIIKFKELNKISNNISEQLEESKEALTDIEMGMDKTSYSITGVTERITKQIKKKDIKSYSIILCLCIIIIILLLLIIYT